MGGTWGYINILPISQSDDIITKTFHYNNLTSSWDVSSMTTTSFKASGLNV